MDRETIQRAVMSVLAHIQKSGNYPVPALTGATRPLEDLEGFDSQMGVTATGLLATALGIPIAADHNLFRVEGGTRKLTIDEVVGILVGLVAAHTASPAASATPATPSAPGTP